MHRKRVPLSAQEERLPPTKTKRYTAQAGSGAFSMGSIRLRSGPREGARSRSIRALHIHSNSQRAPALDSCSEEIIPKLLEVYGWITPCTHHHVTTAPLTLCESLKWLAASYSESNKKLIISDDYQNKPKPTQKYEAILLKRRIIA